jgi:hypothetical protein
VDGACDVCRFIHIGRQLRTLGGDTFELCEREITGEGILGQETCILSKQSDGQRIVLEMGFDQKKHTTRARDAGDNDRP